MSIPKIFNLLKNSIIFSTIFILLIFFSISKSFSSNIISYSPKFNQNILLAKNYSEDIDVEEDELEVETKSPINTNQNLPSTKSQQSPNQLYKKDPSKSTQNTSEKQKKDDIKLQETEEDIYESDLDYFDNLLEQEKRKNQIQTNKKLEESKNTSGNRGDLKPNSSLNKETETLNQNSNSQFINNISNNKVKLNLIITSDIKGGYSDFIYTDEINKNYTLATISTFLKSYKENNKNSEIMLIDLGGISNSILNDALISKNIKKEPTENPMAKSFNFLGYDVISLKQQDIMLNPTSSFLGLLLKDFNNKIITSNLYDYSGVLVFKPINVITKGNLKIAYLSFMASNNENSNKEGVYYTKSLLDSYDSIVLSHLSKDRFDLTVFAVEVNNLEEVKVIEKFLSSKKYNIDIVLFTGNLSESINEKIGKTYFISNNTPNSLLNIDLTLEKTGDSSYTLSKKNTDIIINKIIFDGKYTQDTSISSLYQDFDAFLTKYQSKKLFTLGNQEFLSNNLINKAPEYLVKPSVMGSIIADTLLDASKAKVAIVPLLNNYNLSFYDNTIREVDVPEILKSLNVKNLKVYQFKTKDLKVFLEWAINVYSFSNERSVINIENSGAVKGILYAVQGDIKYEINLKNQSGSKITKITDKNGKVLAENDIITIATLDGGSQAVIENMLFKNREIPIIKNFTVDSQEIFLKYILSLPSSNFNYPISTSWYIMNITSDKSNKK